MYDFNGNWDQNLYEKQHMSKFWANHVLGGLNTDGNWTWHGRQKCQICKGQPEHATHPKGHCQLGGRELALTLADLYDREPTRADLVRSMRLWSAKQNFAFIGFAERGTTAGSRNDHWHWHVLCFGHQCAIELGRATWNTYNGNAWGGQWLDLTALTQTEEKLRASYAAKHASKQHLDTDELPIVRKLYHGPKRRCQIL